jgi:hypothetical protein
VSLENQTWRNELARLKDELHVVSAETTAEDAQLQWQQDVAQDGRPRALSDYHEALGRLQNEEAALESLQLTFDRIARLQGKQATSVDEYDRTRLALKGQAAKVEELRSAVKELEVRVERATALVGQRDAQLSPKRARAEFLRGEIARAERRIAELHIRAPVDGVVLKRFHNPGEWIGKAEALFSILKDGSQEVLVYVQQDNARGFERLGGGLFRCTKSRAASHCGERSCGSIRSCIRRPSRSRHSIARTSRWWSCTSLPTRRGRPGRFCRWTASSACPSRKHWPHNGASRDGRRQCCSGPGGPAAGRAPALATGRGASA